MRCSFINYIASFLLLAATVFFIVVSITSPVINNLGILTVKLPDNSRGDEVSFGSFGWCIQNGRNNGNDLCSSRMVGYNPADVMTKIDGTEFSGYEVTTSKALTRVMVLHPVGAGLSFLAFLISLGITCSPFFIAMASSFFAMLAFIVSIVVLVCDFVTFGLVRSNVNSFHASGSRARWSTGIWMVLAAAVCLFFGTIFAFFSCCLGRRRRNRDHTTRKEEFTTTTPVRSKRRWFGRW